MRRMEPTWYGSPGFSVSLLPSIKAPLGLGLLGLLLEKVRWDSLRHGIGLLLVLQCVARKVLLGKYECIPHIWVCDIEVVLFGETLVWCEAVLEEELQLVLRGVSGGRRAPFSASR